MKITSNKFMKLSFTRLAFMALMISAGPVLVNAESKATGNLISSFSIFNSATTSSKVEVVENEKNTCEHFDNTTQNLLNLEQSSSDTKQKIENVEETIDSESALRDTILSSVKTFFGLQKKDKVIFREMRKDIQDAKLYYLDLDNKLTEIEKYLDENYCDDIKPDLAKAKDEESEDLVEDEGTFRKQFAASLKEKMKILQDGLLDAKK